ncbi:MAG: efflux RND transporter periplasmic adaptor subunit [Spirochaetales bacterium]|nr:efflux RND transporter periplasmic adaptor subunit [Spirochaetales bacterium]
MNKKQLLFILLITGLLVSCNKKTATIEIGNQIHKVRTVIVKRELEYPEIRSFGAISFINKADVTAVLDANIDSIRVREGDTVRKGELLVVLHNPQLDVQFNKANAAIRSAESALALAKAKLWEGQLGVEARLITLEQQDMTLKQKLIDVRELKAGLDEKTALYNVGGISENALETTKSDYEAALASYEILKKDNQIKELGLRDADLVARGYRVPADKDQRQKLIIELNSATLAAEVEVAESNLLASKTELESINLLMKDLRIRAPISGVIGSRYLEQGERVSPGTKVITIFNEGGVYAIFPVQEKDIMNINEGMLVKTIVDAYPDREFSGKIDIISPVIDPQTGSFSVKAKIIDSEHSLKPGMFVRTTIIMDKPRDIIRLPSTALTQKRDNQARIFIVRGNKVFTSAVEAGEEKNGMVEIKSQLKEGELVIDSPPPVLIEGDTVEIIQ